MNEIESYLISKNFHSYFQGDNSVITQESRESANSANGFHHIKVPKAPKSAKSANGFSQ